MIEQKKLCVIVINMKNVTKIIWLIIGLLFAVATRAENYTAVDGDSLAEGERRIRLDGIDAPEFVQNCYTDSGAEYTCGLEALQYLEDLMRGNEIRCDCLPEKDKYNREICECFADDVCLNEAMVFGGFAVT